MKKAYLNTKTGEVVGADGRKDAFKFFKADGKVFNYKVRIWNIRREKKADGIVQWVDNH